MLLKLTALDARICEHRLSADTLAEVAADSYNDEGLAAEIGLACESLCDAVRPLMTRGGRIEITSRAQAWCIAECVEGSTWDGQGGFDHDLQDHYAAQVEKLRGRLNAQPEFVALLGREVVGQGDLEPDGYTPATA